MVTRKESDSIGTMEVPVKAYYGVQTLRAKNNFHITGRPMCWMSAWGMPLWLHVMKS